MRIFKALTAVAMALVCALWATFATATTVADIHSAARVFLDDFASRQKSRGRDANYTIGNLDPRLRLAECSESLTVEFVSDPEKNVRNTLLVSCVGSRPWRLFLNAEIEIFANSYVAAMPLSRGARVTEAMLREEKVIINQTRGGAFYSLEGLTGMEIRRPVREGTLLTPSLLTAPEAIARGDFVKIEAKSGPIVIETTGTAVTAGKIGEQISVENARSGREVRGVIIAPGHVRVIM